MARYIEEKEIYKLFDARGVARLHVGDIDVLPRADVIEVVHGRWEHRTDAIGFFRCSVCRDCNIYGDLGDITKWNYCPNCNAKMDLKG